MPIVEYATNSHAAPAPNPSTTPATDEHPRLCPRASHCKARSSGTVIINVENE